MEYEIKFTRVKKKSPDKEVVKVELADSTEQAISKALIDDERSYLENPGDALVLHINRTL